MNCLPMCPEMKELAFDSLREIRLRCGQKPLYRTAGGDILGQKTLQPSDLLRAAQALTHHSLSLHAQQLSQGFLPVPGGHRLGVCGKMYTEKGDAQLSEISSLCLRIAHAMPGIADDLWPDIRRHSLIILGPPGSGKTTLLRELIRLHAQDGHQVAIADERSEIAACSGGAPQLDIGSADVITLLPKDKALHLLLRSMAPDYLATDEIGGMHEMQALTDARNAGVKLLCTVHAGSMTELLARPGFCKWLRRPLFDAALLLTAPGQPIHYIPTGET